MRIRERLKVARGQVLLSLIWLVKRLCALPALRQLYHAILIGLIKRTELFDREYYLVQNADVARSGIPPLRHYVAYGDREGRAPQPIFDPGYYRAKTPGRLKRVNALLHYAWVGRYQRMSPSPWFDVDYYLSNNKDVFRSGWDPLLHFLKWGGQEGRLPSPLFDSGYYLRSNPDVVESRLNPLIHYLLIGRLEGRPVLPHGSIDLPSEKAAIPEPPLPDPRSWSALRPRANVADAVVDVIVPVYKGRSETLRCIYNALASFSDTSFELIVIDDGSPEAKLAADLRYLASQGLFTLLINAVNVGFVCTVNRGMRVHPGRDVVLLNSDAEVYDGWLDRIRSTAYRDRRIGTVTPLSNNATICSYPHFLHDNPYPLELSYPDLDRLAAKANAGVHVDAPTGVGFCMYIKRECLDDVGLFDEKAFGKGYGEENDFCQRAIGHGWRNVIAGDVFVRHWGAASFQGEKAKRVDAAMRVLSRRYPSYQKDVADFIRRDPLREIRRRIDIMRLTRLRKETKNVLIVCHSRGGGTERHVQEDIRRLVGEGCGVSLLRPATGVRSHVVIGHQEAKSLPNIGSVPLADTDALAGLLTMLGVDEIHVHSLVDLEPTAPAHLMRLAHRLKVRVEVNLHDYEVICPRINLADENGRYCGEPAVEACNRCLASRGSDFGVSDIRAWRDLRRKMLLSAEAVLVPDQDVADRLHRYFPDVAVEVSPHEELAVVQALPKPVATGRRMRILIPGAIGKLKGFDVVLACARDAQARRLPLDFIIMGYTMNDRVAQEAGIEITGKYQEADAVELLRGLTPDVVWLPSLWPETYSYTLSLALIAGFPVFAFDLGAIARRLRANDMGQWLMPLSLVDQPAAINELFVKYMRDSAGKPNSHAQTGVVAPTDLPAVQAVP